MRYFKNKRVLVTGASGFIGKHVARELARRDARVIGTYLYHSPEQFQGWTRADLLDAGDCERIVKDIDYVFHCAANTSGAGVIATTPDVHVVPNLRMNANLLKAATKAGVRKFLFISSSTVYPPDDEPMAEDSGFNSDPFPAYFGVGWMKRYTEKLCEFYYRTFGIECIVVRSGNAYGPEDKFDPKLSHVIPALIRRGVAKEDPFVVWGDGSEIKDFIYIDDLINGILLAFEKLSGFDVVNVASGVETSIRYIVDFITRYLDYAGEIVYDTSKPTMIPVRRINIDKVRSLGFVPKVKIDEGLRKTIEWYEQTVSIGTV